MDPHASTTTFYRPWLLIGRDDVLACMASHLEHRGALLVGDAGVGKSRLAHEALDAAARRGAATEWFTATASAAQIPLGALVDVVPPTARGSGLELLQQVGAGLVARAKGRSLLVGVDDVHLLDPASATVIHHLVATGRARFLGTARSLSDVPDAVLALWKDEEVARIDVPPLPAADVDRLIECILDGPVSPTVRLHLSRFCEGNPLLLRETIADAIDALVLRQHGVSWHWHGAATVGPRLTDLITARLGQLDPADRDLLGLLSLGEPLSLRLVGRLAPRASVERLERRGLLVVDEREGRHQARLAHPLYGEVLRTALPSSRRPALCRRLADSRSADEGSGPDYTLRQACWLLESDGEPDPALFADAATRALNRFDPLLAERLSRAAVSHLGAAVPHLGSAPALVLGTSLALQGRLAEATQVLTPLLRHPSSEVRAEAGTALARGLALAPSAGPDGAQVLRQVLTTALEPYWSSILRADLADLLLGAGELAEPLVLATAVFDDPAADERLRLRALWAAQGALTMTGRQQEAVVWGEDLASSVRRQPRWNAVASRALASHGVSLLYAGRLADALELAAAGLDDAVTNEDWVTHGAWACLLGWVILYQGRPVTAQIHLTQAEVLLRERDPDRLGTLTAALQCQASVLTGDGAAAGLAAAEAVPGDSRALRPFDQMMTGALAWRHAAHGELSRARRELLTAADDADRRGAHAIAMHVLHDALRLDGGRAVARRLSTLSAGQQGRWAPAFGQHAGAVLSGRGEDHLAAAEAFVRVGATLHSAEAAACASHAFTRAGHVAAARAAAAQSRVLAVGCEGAGSPMLALAEAPPDLTAREREIAGLAAHGMSNIDIASSLVVSARTVEGHLYRAYGKLGITARHQLTTVIPTPGDS